MNIFANRAAGILLRGGVIAYPTEGVFGLGCLPADDQAVVRLLQIKQRPPTKGLIIIFSHFSQLHGWVEIPRGIHLPESDPRRPTTWLVPRGEKVTPLVLGNNAEIAIRLTNNAIVEIDLRCRRLTDCFNQREYQRSANRAQSLHSSPRIRQSSRLRGTRRLWPRFRSFGNSQLANRRT